MYFNIRIYGYRVLSDIRADQRRRAARAPPAALQRRPPPAALTGTALSLLHAWTLCTPLGQS
jgi:hypothetical protein